MNKEFRELGESYEPTGWDWPFLGAFGSSVASIIIVVAVIIAVLAVTGLDDAIINSFE